MVFKLLGGRPGGGRLEGGDITRGRLGNAAGGSFLALQPPASGSWGSIVAIIRRHSLHESHPTGSVHCGGSVRGSRRYDHFDGYATPSLVQHGPGGRLRPPRTASFSPRDCLDFADVGCHLVAKEQRAVESSRFGFALVIIKYGKSLISYGHFLAARI
jgi:hypothetical protein